MKRAAVAVWIAAMGALAFGCAWETGATDGQGGAGGAGLEAIGSAESSIRGGTVTTARPEIGRFGRSGGFGCTTTLITNRYAISAAHCLGDDYQNVTVHPNAAVTVDLTATNKVSRGVSRYWSFGSHDTEKIWNGLSSDVLLIRLDGTFSGVAVKPVAIAEMTSTSATAWSTRFGYGCTDLDTREGSGIKRFVSFQGLRSHNGCYGDSGGPVMKGQGVNSMPIYGITSGDAGDITGWYDIIADAAYHKKHMEAAMIAWDGDIAVDVDRPGADYESFRTVSGAMCRDECMNDSSCHAWSWYQSTCRLKGAVPGFVPVTGAFSGIKPNRGSGWETNFDRPGAGYNTFSVTSDDACRAACVRDYRCQAFTSGPSSTGVKTCWLKDEQPNPVAKSGGFRSAAKRGIKAHRYWSGVSHFHTFTYSMPSPEICQADCAARSNCEAWTYRGGAQFPTARSPQCWLYATEGTLSSTPNNYVSGVKGEEFR